MPIANSVWVVGFRYIYSPGEFIEKWSPPYKLESSWYLPLYPTYEKLGIQMKRSPETIRRGCKPRLPGLGITDLNT